METLISVVTFALVTMIMFNMSSKFFGIFRIQDSKQTVNQSFIKAYGQLNSDLRITDSSRVYTYYSENKHNKARWTFFPIPTDENGNSLASRDKLNWGRICIYYLRCTDENCKECGSSTIGKRDDAFKSCSDKQLIRLVYSYEGENDNQYFAKAQKAMSENIFTFLLPYGRNYPQNPEYALDDYKNRPAKYSLTGKSIVARNLLDFRVHEDIKKVSVYMSTVRKENSKNYEHGNTSTDFTAKPWSKFREELEWVVHTKNSR